MSDKPTMTNDLTRKYGFSPHIETPLFAYTSDSDLKKHPSYKAAKAGDIAAAIQLVSDLAVSFIYEHRHKFSSNPIFVAPHAKEASGDNAIPQVLAEVCALVSGVKSDQEIVQTTRVFHTGADPMERMSLRAQFEGPVEPNGEVINAFVLVNAGRTPKFKPDVKTIELLEKRFGNEITEIFDITPAALTANEAQYLVGFRTADEIRNRLAKAREETDRRLRSKGIEG